MTKSSIFLIIAIFLFSISCKKKTTTPNDATSNTVVSDGIMGYFICGTYFNNLGPIVDQGPSLNVVFYNSPTIGLYHPNEEKLSKVSVNNDTLSYFGEFGYRLNSPTNPFNINMQNWAVIGNNTIPTFNFTNNTPLPTCSDFTVIPDSVSKTNGCTFTIQNVNNMTSGTILISGGGIASTNYTLSTGDNTIKIMPYQLSNTTIGETDYIDLQIQNTITRTFYGKKFSFVKEVQIIKKLKIIS